MFRILAIQLAASVLVTVSADEPEWQKWPEAAQTPRAEAARVAVLDWCEPRNGVFGLTEDGQPYCGFVDENGEITGAFLGVWDIALGSETGWWWEIRSRQTPGMQSGVLWLVDPFNHPPSSEEVSPELDREIMLSFECIYMRYALNNPARISVVLMGPGIEQCMAWIEEHEAALDKIE